MDTYTALKSIHVIAVVTTIALFALRGAWMLASSQRLAQRWVQVVPHVVDTVLLASALAMLMVAGWSPVQPWLATKIVGLLIYIALGTVALKRGRTRTARTIALAGALLTFAWIIAVAITKSPWPIG